MAEYQVSLQLAIAGKVNEAGFKASQGGEFQAVQVQRIYERVSD